MVIYYHCPDTNLHIGGIKILYKHVELLNENGIQAYILHGKKGFTCTWFSHNAPITYFDICQIDKEDYVVISETYFYLISNYQINFNDNFHYHFRKRKTDVYVAKKIWALDCKKILFIQNAYYSFVDFNVGNTPNIPSISTTLQKIFCISNQNKSYLDYIIDDKIEIIRLQWSLDFELFSYKKELKKRIITYMPRKNSSHSKQVINILKTRNRLNGFEIEPIVNMNELQVAEKLSESTIFLSFGYPEGLPLPPAEAMASGCIVIGYNGGGGEEYFIDEHCITIPFGDIITFCKKIEEVCQEFDNKLEFYQQMALDASNFINHNYSQEREKEILLDAWKNLIN